MIHNMQVRVAIQSTGGLLTAFPFFAKEEQLLKRVALLLRPMYALAGEPIHLVTQSWGFLGGSVARPQNKTHPPPPSSTMLSLKKGARSAQIGDTI